MRKLIIILQTSECAIQRWIAEVDTPVLALKFSGDRTFVFSARNAALAQPN